MGESLLKEIIITQYLKSSIYKCKQPVVTHYNDLPRRRVRFNYFNDYHQHGEIFSEKDFLNKLKNTFYINWLINRLFSKWVSN